MQQVDGKARAKLVLKNIAVVGGFIHQIDSVLVPSITAPTMPPADPTIAALVAGNRDLSTLLKLATSIGLDKELEKEGKLTVFAPVDAAFAFFSPDSQPTDDELAMILRNHIVDGAVLSSDLSDGQVVQTQSGQTLTVSIAGGNVKLMSEKEGVVATVTKANVMAANGVVHIIDNVLDVRPKDGPLKTIMALVDDEASLSTLKTAVDAADLRKGLDNPDAEITLFAPTNDAFQAVDQTALEQLLADKPSLTSVLG